MKKMRVVIAASALMLAMSFVLGTMPVSAEDGAVGACPTAFELHAIGHHGGGMGGGEMEHMHKHVGLSMDAMDTNGDGYVCMKKVGKDGGIHVHVDNNLPLKKR
ncbi:hypothetical protein GC175_14850 [bacterium]|nr:hypothetical protein [bacterium]